MDHIHEYLLRGLLPEDTKEPRKTRIQAPQYKLIRGNLYKRFFFTSWLHCVAPPQTDKIIKEIYEGSCGFNVEPRSLVVRIMKQDLCKGLKATQSFSPVTIHMEIMHHIERQLTRSQQGWVDNLAKTLWIHRTLPRNSQKETPFSLTYGSEAVIPIIETTDDRVRVQKATKRKEIKEVASIEKAYYRNKLRKYHSARSSHPTYIMGYFVLLK
ncbi:reverse transcriptase domain-containing protein [Tanacetum coccineum]